MTDEENKVNEPDENENKKGNEWDWEAKTPDMPEDSFEIEELVKEDKEEAEEVIEDVIEEENAEEISDDDSEEENGKTEDGCCIICGEKIRRGKSELYCDECREKYLKVNYGASHVIMSIVMVFVAVIGIIMFFSTSNIAKNIFDGNNYAEKNQISTALDSYSAAETTASTLNDALNAFLQGISSNFKTVSLFDSGKATQQKQAVLMLKVVNSNYESRDAFCALVDSAFTAKELESEKFSEIKDCYDFCKKMDETANEIYTDWYPLLEEYMGAFDENGERTKEDAPTMDELIKVIDDYAANNPDAEMSTVEFYKFMSAYYEYAYYKTADPKDMLQHVKDAYKAAGKFGYFYADNLMTFAWECKDTQAIISTAEEMLKFNPSNENSYYYAAKAYAFNKEFDKAVALCEKLKEYNPESLEYYTIQSELLRRKGDFNASVDICEKGEENGTDPELLRQKSISYFLLEEKDKAVEAAKAAYEATYSASYTGGSVSLEILNTTALICYLTDDKDTYNEIKGLLENQQYELEDSVKEIIKGDKTFEDVFMGERGDI